VYDAAIDSGLFAQLVINSVADSTVKMCSLLTANMLNVPYE
jgi:hypothetical protein